MKNNKNYLQVIYNNIFSLKNISNMFYSIKQSYSLIELSIYIAVIGILSSATLISYKIYENAKVAKIVEDIEYYDNAFVGFTVKYGTIPGNMSFNRCQKFPEFQSICRLSNKTRWTKTDTVYYNADNALNYSQNTNQDRRIVKLFTMRQLQHSGFISHKVKIKLEDTIEKIMLDNREVNFDPTNFIHIYSYDITDKVCGSINYNIDARVSINGIIKGITPFLNERTTYHEGREIFYGELPSEKQFNVLHIFYNTSSAFDNNASHPSVGIGAKALFTADFMKKIDCKIDDCLPRRGKIMGTRIYNGIDPYFTGNNTMSCYNKNTQLAESSSVKAEYVSNQDLSRGCNLLYLLKDVSEYVY